jgi:hypothetical protein
MQDLDNYRLDIPGAGKDGLVVGGKLLSDEDSGKKPDIDTLQ